MPIKNTVRYHFTPIRMAKKNFLKKLTIPSGEEKEQPESSHIVGGNTKWYSYFEEW